MRTTLTIDDDVLAAARALADHENRSIGEVISDLARKSLRPRKQKGERNGIPLLEVRHGTPAVTLDIVNALRDETP